MISKLEQNRRMELYSLKLSDKEAAKILFISREAFRKWRNKNKLKPSNNHDERLTLYNIGLSDVQIGKKLYLTRQAIQYWRRVNGLPANNHKRKKAV